jgi:hypothetical protein
MRNFIRENNYVLIVLVIAVILDYIIIKQI